MVKRGEIKAHPAERGRARANYNLQLAHDVSGLRAESFIEFNMGVAGHREDEPEYDDEQHSRLGYHLTVLQRIYTNPDTARTVPELEEIGEGSDWL